MIILMGAHEIIKEITRLPESEKDKVVAFVRHLPNTETLKAINEPLEGLPRFASVEELFDELAR